ncbi:MAG: hypothetical protein BACA_04325 [Bacteroides fragilis]
MVHVRDSSDMFFLPLLSFLLSLNSYLRHQFQKILQKFGFGDV